MKLIRALLDYTKPWHEPDVYLFTGNPVTKRNGAIVMGRGAAKQVRDTFPGIDISFGNALKMGTPNKHLAWVSFPGDQHLGWFKVKHHWADDADVDLIKESAMQLGRIADMNPDLVFHMNYPGVGNGKLNEKDVEQHLQVLPDNVVLYR
jgi:hypothetical protein